VPVCFALSEDGGSLYITIDEKPKDTARPLKRIRNIQANPQVALVADHYTEDWTQLAWVMVRGRAAVLEPAPGEHAAAQALLRTKYPQYRQMALDDLPVIAVRIERLTWWGRLV
jgi:PPOX class probable F420-dependent enzyme